MDGVTGSVRSANGVDGEATVLFSCVVLALLLLLEPLIEVLVQSKNKDPLSRPTAYIGVHAYDPNPCGVLDQSGNGLT